MRALGIMSRYRDANMTAPPKVPRIKPKYGPKLREARFKDYDQIAGLESRFGLAVKPYEEWVHLWQGNPLYRELKTGWPIGWVLEDEGGKIVGSMGNIPFLYELDGRRIRSEEHTSELQSPVH